MATTTKTKKPKAEKAEKPKAEHVKAKLTPETRSELDRAMRAKNLNGVLEILVAELVE